MCYICEVMKKEEWFWYVEGFTDKKVVVYSSVLVVTRYNEGGCSQVLYV